MPPSSKTVFPVAAMLLPLLAGCAGEGTSLKLPSLISKDRPPATSAETVAALNQPVSLQSSQTGPRVPSSTETGGANISRVIPDLDGSPKALTFEQAPLPAFVNAVFGQILALNVQMDPQVASRTDLVTLRTGKPQEPGELFALAREVLRNYGVAVSYDGQVVQVVPDASLAARQPQVIRGRTSPEVPGELRPVFQFLPLNHVSPASMQEWLSNAFGQNLTVIAAPKSSAVLLLGLPEAVSAAVDAVRTLDEPKLAGQQSMKFEPVYWSSTALARKLTEILMAEGYDAVMSVERPAAINLLPVEHRNAIIAFAGDPQTLAHITQWVRDLDQPAKADPLRNAFVYFVRNTTASSLGEVVSAALGGREGRGGTTASQSSTNTVPATLQTIGGMTEPPSPSLALSNVTDIGDVDTAISSASTSGAAASEVGAQGKLVVDSARNALVFIGSAEDYARVRGLMETLDQSPREALIEVTVAEVTLTDSTQLGVEWALSFGLGNGYTADVENVLDNVVNPAKDGLNFAILNSKGAYKAVLKAFASDNRVSILSTPRLLARSGSRAEITVGTEIPIVTSQGTTDIENNGDAAILQQIQYRNTGIILKVRPVIHSQDRIDLELSQEVSEAGAETAGVATSSVTPPILNRSITTQLSLRDGATVLLGGLISETRGQDITGIPFLKDLPGVGALFRNETLSNDKTELLVFITPYIINTQDDSSRISNTFQRRMEDWPKIDTELRPFRSNPI